MYKRIVTALACAIIAIGIFGLAGCPTPSDPAGIKTPGIDDISKDKTAPVITLAGGVTTLTLAVGGTYTPVVATATDNVDGDLTAAIVIGGGTVTTAANATFTVTYNVSDAAGNAAAQKTVTVTVGTGSSSSADPSAAAPSPTAAALSNAVVFYSDVRAPDVAVTSWSDIWDPGFIFSEMDIASNNTLKYIAPNHGDAAGILFPSTNLSGKTHLHMDWYVVGLTSIAVQVIDAAGGNVKEVMTPVTGSWVSVDLPLSAMVGNKIFTGVHQMGLTFYNTAGSTSASRVYVDNIYFYGGTVIDPETVGPVITLSGQASMSIAVDGTYTEPGATVTDNQDTGLTATITGTVNTAVAGVYTVTYTATDSDGNTTVKTRKVYVGTSANLILNGDFESNDGASWSTYGGASASYNYSSGACKATIPAKLGTNWAVQHYQNIALPAGTYEFSFDYSATINSSITVSIENPGYTSFLSTGTDGKPVLTATSAVQSFSNTFTMTAAEAVSKVNFMLGLCESGAVVTIDNVVVRAVTAAEIGPVITLSGSSPMTVIQGGTYTEPGATALDNVDGSVTGAIITTGTVNTAAVGTYTITYTVTDSDGNVSTAARTVNVVAALVHPAPLASPSPASLATAILVYTDTAKPAGATQANLTWGVLEGESVSTRAEVAVGGNNMLHFTMTGVMRRVVSFDPINLTGKRIHFEIYSYGNAAEPAGPNGITPNEFKMEIRSSESARNTCQQDASPEGTWVTVDKLVSECNFAGATANLASVTSITFNENLSTLAPQAASGFYIDNLYFY